ncbi:hypothetical protein PIB30_092636 [Stylosanthes scabra]|uniref:Uncharacterized protein n=1 Tax=Stylosanthes scabra TaxID=79078 RepID=A0ABU6WUU7_9FABA|nr:hypothetical protein [Stylosanthes scabra]
MNRESSSSSAQLRSLPALASMVEGTMVVAVTATVERRNEHVNAGPEHKVRKLKIRIIRLWSVAHFATYGMKASVEVVILDKESILAEGNMYVITDFTAALNTIKFKATKYEFRVHFKKDTIVHPIQDS